MNTALDWKWHGKGPGRMLKLEFHPSQTLRKSGSKHVPSDLTTGEHNSGVPAAIAARRRRASKLDPSMGSMTAAAAAAAAGAAGAAAGTSTAMGSDKRGDEEHSAILTWAQTIVSEQCVSRVCAV